MTKKKVKDEPSLPSEVVKRRFAIEYVRDFNAVNALARTYDIKPTAVSQDLSLREQANVLPHDPATNEMIEQQLTWMQDRVSVDREFLILKTRQILDQCMKAVPVMEKVRGKLVESGDYEFDSLGAIKAVQNLYVFSGIKQLRQVVEDDASTGVMLVPDQVTPEDWANVVAKTRDMQDTSLTNLLTEFNPEGKAN
jgi:hypothetical protein